MVTLYDIKQYYREVFLIEDDTILDMVIGLAISAKLAGDPIWLLIIGASSSGKTEIVNILTKISFVHPISTMTDNTLLSGMKSSNGSENSMLHRIGNRGMIVMKDYTSVLSMRSEKRDAIVSQFREVFDGEISKQTGNGNSTSWKGKINWVGCVTDSVYIKEGESAGMGRRTINYVMPQPDAYMRKQITKRATQNIKDIDAKREKLQDMTKEFVMRKISELTVSSMQALPEDVMEDLIDIADFMTVSRTPTERNFRDELVLVPDAEMPMRSFKALYQAAQGMIAASEQETLSKEQRNLLFKLAIDSIPKQRRLMLNILSTYPSCSKKGAALALGYPTETVAKWLEDLNVLGVCDRKPDYSTMTDYFTMRPMYAELYRKNTGLELVSDKPLVGNEDDSTPTKQGYAVSGYGGYDDRGRMAEIKAMEGQATEAFLKELREAAPPERTIEVILAEIKEVEKQMRAEGVDVNVFKELQDKKLELQRQASVLMR